MYTYILMFVGCRVIKFFDKNNLFSNHQFGFRARFATEYAIADIYDKLISNLDKKLNSCAIFLDLAKAFDSVSHEILLRKLQCYGIRGKALQLFKSYLSGRSQFVKLADAESSLMNIVFGVPQGSILGPLLFLIYINDLPDATNFYVKLFADDTFLCAQHEQFSVLESEVNCELEKVFGWLASNKLTLNLDKSKFMIISNSKSIPNLGVHINGLPLKECDSYKYLGVMIDKNLNWSCHIEYIGQKISKACGALAKIRHCVSLEILKNVFYALVHSYLRYGILIWGSASRTTLKPLEVLVNKAIRIMLFAPFGNLDFAPLYQELELLDLDNIVSYELGKFMFKSKKDLLPVNIGNYQEIEYGQRRSGLIDRHRPPRIKCRIMTGEKSIQSRGSKLWESLPDDLKSCESFKMFKRQYKKYLITTRNDNDEDTELSYLFE